ncbi:hypothetical protein BB561_006509 [Smittium simulii]|uniref:Reverse transcriptase domain-containing protein n=1 Tax=Smittium simulii TaxID=133385 RepID=A0A2T9Y3H0_9FUNG|nr:hypothetical protein BB561_006509 [Smittium simulii]
MSNVPGVIPSAAAGVPLIPTKRTRLENDISSKFKVMVIKAIIQAVATYGGELFGMSATRLTYFMSGELEEAQNLFKHLLFIKMGIKDIIAKLKANLSPMGTITDMSAWGNLKIGQFMLYDMKVVFKKNDPEAEIPNLLKFEHLQVPITYNRCIEAQIQTSEAVIIKKNHYELQNNSESLESADNFINKTIKKKSNITTALKTTPSSKAAGIDTIPSELWKLVQDEIQQTSVAVPIFKNGNCQVSNNYRRISLIPTITKLIAKIVANKLNAFDTKYNTLCKEQAGFRAKEGCVAQATTYMKLLNAENLQILKLI